MSNNLGSDRLLVNQASKETTVNTALDQIDAAMTEVLNVSVASGNATITSPQYRGNRRFNIQGAATNGRTVTLQAVKKESLIVNESATHAVAIVLGSTSISLAASSQGFASTDGTANGLILFGVTSSGGVSTAPYDVGFWIDGKPTASEEVFKMIIPRAVTFADDFAGSYATAEVAATASTVFSIEHNGVAVGTLTFALGATTGTFATTAGALAVAAGGTLKVIAPATPDATLEDIAITFAGTR